MSWAPYIAQKQYCHPRVTINNGVMCPTLLDRWFEIESTSIFFGGHHGKKIALLPFYHPLIVTQQLSYGKG